jgi:hypothetical protein
MFHGNSDNLSRSEILEAKNKAGSKIQATRTKIQDRITVTRLYCLAAKYLLAK